LEGRASNNESDNKTAAAPQKTVCFLERVLVNRRETTMSIVEGRALTNKEKRLLDRLPRETSVSLDCRVVRLGYKRQYDVDKFIPTASQMRREMNEERAEYLRERLHRVDPRIKDKSWQLWEGRREDMEFFRDGLPNSFEDYEEALLCPISRKVGRIHWPYTSWALIKDYFCPESGEIIAMCIVGESGRYYIHCEDDKVPHPSGISRSLRLADELTKMLKKYSRNIANAED
jgi:hypothetical protein